MVGILDYGMGNLLSVYSAFDYLAADVKICKHPEDLEDVDRIVIPGVGAFKDCIDKINNNGFREVLEIEVLKKGKPTLGICLGMQIMASKGTEGGDYNGLGWFDATVTRLHPTDTDKRVPNIGWNDVAFNSKVPLFKGLPDKVDFYLVHSFYMKTINASDVVATYDYDYPVTAAVLKNNIFATQFHPEKSQDFGLKILENFIAWNP
ncbi:MAG: imidazole glycerol phosphate synthase subunit HisH [Cytophagia bacterium]|nr:imidazole glycerol phosphate synthase subunit HisH [Cytophagia bacterium]NBW34972.1 imidazole glycerol phosphate synthase subunit HisH [Cytophagia bacterium]